MKKSRPVAAPSFDLRTHLLLGLFALAAMGLIGRCVWLQLVNNDFLMSKGDQAHMRVVSIPAHRGRILDRNGQALAVSAPVYAITGNPHLLADHQEQWATLGAALKRPPGDLERQLSSNTDRTQLLLARQMRPADALSVMNLGLPGLTMTREYRRYFPVGEVAGHLLGFTDIDELGQEGMEKQFDNWLAGSPGRKRVLQDAMATKVADVESLVETVEGRDVTLSIDLRIQYLAYRELKAAMQYENAKTGSIIVMDVNTGEVLALVNQPGFNPNDRSQYIESIYRNRAATAILEPGSTMKPFVMSVALESGRYNENSRIDISSGMIKVGSKVIEDEHPLGVASLETILAKSSNVGMSTIALTLEPQQIWSTLRKFGFGQTTGSGLVGESQGMFTHYSNWRPPAIASLSYGYGVSVTPLQLAHAYSTLASFGVSRPVSLLRVDGPVTGERVISDKTAHTMVTLLESVVSPAGTARAAAIAGYRVSGKTGTAQKSAAGGYSNDYVALFCGMAPATNPRLVTVVVIDAPKGATHHGGDTAAPVFSTVMGGALRLLGVPPDDADAAREDPLSASQTLVRR